MLRKIFLTALTVSIFITGCQTGDTQTYEQALTEKNQIIASSVDTLEQSVMGNDIALAMIEEPTKEVLVARDFNKLSKAVIGARLTLEERQVLEQYVLNLVNDVEQTKANLQKKIDIAEKNEKRLIELEDQINKLQSDVFRNSKNWEDQERNKLWDRVTGFFSGILKWGFWGIIIYVLIATGLLPVVIGIFSKMVATFAGAAPKLFYGLGVVARDSHEALTDAISDIRNEKKNIINSADYNEEDKKRAAEDLDKINKTLDSHLKVGSKKHKLIEHARAKKNK